MTIFSFLHIMAHSRVLVTYFISVCSSHISPVVQPCVFGNCGQAICLTIGQRDAVHFHGIHTVMLLMVHDMITLLKFLFNISVKVPCWIYKILSKVNIQNIINYFFFLDLYQKYIAYRSFFHQNGLV